ncbi:Olfactory receptor 6M1 [Chelonia mydas]|uniref:Olfactory receptor 6M1 n=1 Tax=Chelonia mydas TaxID=8469 RepID=M7AQ16_CHEMY|nr:Olfactory receptor 6M1 [Chelonia mydas]
MEEYRPLLHQEAPRGQAQGPPLPLRYLAYAQMLGVHPDRFPHNPQPLQLLFVCRVLASCLLMLYGNGVITGITLSDHWLRSPMNFFRHNFSFVEIWFPLVTVSKLLAGFFLGCQTMSFAGCMAQCYFYFLLGAADFLLVGVMSFDRYQAICNPLHFCLKLVCSSWAAAFATILGPLILVTRLPYCSPSILNNFLCARTLLVGPACSKTEQVEAFNLVLAAGLILSSLVLMGISYSDITLAVLCIPSSWGHHRTFSTCASHMVVITIVYGSRIFMHVRTSHAFPEWVDKALALMTSIVVPSVNLFM